MTVHNRHEPGGLDGKSPDFTMVAVPAPILAAPAPVFLCRSIVHMLESARERCVEILGERGSLPCGTARRSVERLVSGNTGIESEDPPDMTGGQFLDLAVPG